MKKRPVKNWKRIRIWFLLVIVLVVLLFAHTFLVNSKPKENTFEIFPSPTTCPTVSPFPTEFPTNNPLPTLKPTIKPVDWQSITISESELIAAINHYRQSQGKSVLNLNEGLCQEARKRALDLTNQNTGRWPPFILGHEPFLKDVNDGTVGKLSGLTFFGENVASSNCKKMTDGSDVFVHNATQLVEECFASSASHKETMLKSDWTNVCSSGRYPFYVQIFGNK